MRLALAGISHHRAPVELRERVAIDLASAGALARELAERDGERCEAVVLSTCNRTELYLARPDDEALPERADRALLALAGDEGAALSSIARCWSGDA